MNRDEILAAAKNSAGMHNEYEDSVADRGTLWSVAALFIVSIALFAVRYFVTGGVDVGIIAVLMAVSGTELIYRWKKLKEKKNLIFGILQLTISLIAIIAYVGQVFAK